MSPIKSKPRIVPDFQKQGIIFMDYFPHRRSNRTAYLFENFVKHYGKLEFDLVVGIDYRGFIFGSALACQLEKGFVPI